MSAPANWYDSLPTPTSKSDTITAEELHAKLIAGGKGVLVVDTRRQDLDVSLLLLYVLYFFSSLTIEFKRSLSFQELSIYRLTPFIKPFQLFIQF